MTPPTQKDEKRMKLNEKGQCPVCLVKPLTYKKDNQYFCFRCNRAFSMDTGKQVNNFAYHSNGDKK
jgi:hypothetical protein